MFSVAISFDQKNGHKKVKKMMKRFHDDFLTFSTVYTLDLPPRMTSGK